MEESKILRKVDQHSKEWLKNELPVGPGSLLNAIRATAYRINIRNMNKLCFLNIIHLYDENVL